MGPIVRIDSVVDGILGFLSVKLAGLSVQAGTIVIENAVGNVGSGKASELKDHLAKTYPVILNDGEIDLGTLRNERLLYMDDPEVVKFVENLLSYALLRDEYREKVKRRSKKA